MRADPTQLKRQKRMTTGRSKRSMVSDLSSESSPDKRLSRAWDHLGRTSEERARWLFSFAWLDLNGRSAEERENLRWQLGAFLDPPPEARKVSTWVVHPIPDHTVTACHDLIAEGIRRLVSTG